MPWGWQLGSLITVVVFTVLVATYNRCQARRKEDRERLNRFDRISKLI